MSNLENRALIIDELRRELVGPAPAGMELSFNDNEIAFEHAEDLNKPWRQFGTGEEIIRRDNPCKRYGVGVLYPVGILLSEDQDEEQAGDLVPVDDQTIIAEDVVDDTEQSTESLSKSLEQIIERGDKGDGEGDTEEFELSTANSYHPSSMAISFLAEFPPGSRLVISVPSEVEHQDGYSLAGTRLRKVNGTYKPVIAKAGEKRRTWWLRHPVSFKVEYTDVEVCMEKDGRVTGGKVLENDCHGLNLSVEVFSRAYGSINKRLITVSLVNRTPYQGYGKLSETCLFQAYFCVTVETPDKQPCILPYPGPPMEKMDEEEKSLNLLYGNFNSFAVGHGCAGSWGLSTTKAVAQWVSAECLPVVEIPSMSPDLKRKDGSVVKVSMADLAGLTSNDGLESLEEIVELYNEWIAEQENNIKDLPFDYQYKACEHMRVCRDAHKRMAEGIDYLKKEPTALKAFRLANHAMLLQQVRAKREPRLVKFNIKTQSIVFDQPYQAPDLENLPHDKGYWRAFQIAFLIMSLKSVAEGDDTHRENVELIWFPTGGGKTEAYLGLAAFSIFLRRLRDPSDVGLHVFMRYTLRLLTSQQFQRACSLICAMEYLRKQNLGELGTKEFSIGLWLGQSTTPNTRQQGKSALRSLVNDPKWADNPFVIRKCPWCNAQLGPMDVDKKEFWIGKKPKSVKAQSVFGYKEQDGTVVIHCSDPCCDYSDKLPVYLIDEDIYEHRPDIIIATIDKFAMLAWNPGIKSLFGINVKGERFVSPPGVIIQDELHLISGPLGSLSGLYEVVIEELCTDYRRDDPVKPKIICSTATIRRYEDQVSALYARKSVSLFPPPGIDASDSFFSQYARNENGELLPGKIYVGVCAPSLGSMQTIQVRTVASLLQAPMKLPKGERDPWWTILQFFNSIRELGTSISLLQSDIPDYLKTIMLRYGINYDEARYLNLVKELTSRLREDEIPRAIEDLEVTYGSSIRKMAVDTCLASNIIEVGVDIDRLSLMVVVGQPKSTSQYIQVTGRVGRKWWERPGLVVTLYSPSKPRDKSHYEKFRTYHERLYAQVEPTSVTPFSEPVLERALHAVLAAYVRQSGNANMAMSPYPFPEEQIDKIKDIVSLRVDKVDPGEKQNLFKVCEKRARQWKKWERTAWGSFYPSGDEAPLLRPAGAYVKDEWKPISWPTMTSMRNVDSQCQVEITKLFLIDDEEV